MSAAEAALVRPYAEADLAQLQFPETTTLAALHVPVLVVTGKRSRWHSASVRLADLLPDARLVELDCDHYVPDEEPAALRREIEAFLSTPEMPT